MANAEADVYLMLTALPFSLRLRVSDSTAAPGLLTFLPGREHSPAPAELRVVAGDGLTPVVADAQGRIVLGRLGSRLYVLADPDLLANHALADPAAARVAADIVASVAPADGAIVFDVTLNGFATSYSLGQLVFHPPFLGLTLCLVIAALIAGIAAIPAAGGRQRSNRLQSPLASGR